MWEGVIPQYLVPAFEALAIERGIERQKAKREFNRESALKGLGK